MVFGWGVGGEVTAVGAGKGIGWGQIDLAVGHVVVGWGWWLCCDYCLVESLWLRYCDETVLQVDVVMGLKDGVWRGAGWRWKCDGEDGNADDDGGWPFWILDEEFLVMVMIEIGSSLNLHELGSNIVEPPQISSGYIYRPAIEEEWSDEDCCRIIILVIMMIIYSISTISILALIGLLFWVNNYFGSPTW